MMDFKNPEYLKLRSAPNAFDDELTPLLCPQEAIIGSYKSVRDGVVFTNKRIFVISVQGMTGLKKDITSLPYSKIQAFSIETAGAFDLDNELELWFSGLGRVRLEFAGRSNITDICKVIGTYTL